MFTRKTFVVLALLCGAGSAYSVGQVHKGHHKVVPLSKEESKIKTCEVHHTALNVENVPIIYGLIGFMPGYFEAKQRDFPHASSAVMGGCVISSASPKEQTVKFCPQCRLAEKRWGNAHKRSPSKH
jgi:hypothetical protein